MVLLAVAMGISMVFIDISVIPVAIPTIRKQFHLSGVMGDWIVNAYTVALTILFIPGSRMSERLGAKRALLLGMAIFAFASGLGGFSESGEWLIASRAVLGFGGALMIPSASYVLMMHFPKGERGKALSTYLSIGSIFLVFGPVIGGVLTHYWTWRGVFWINFPIGVMGLCAITTLIPQYPPKRVPFDFLGFVWLGSAVLCLTLAVMQGDKWGWTSWPILWLFGMGFALFASSYFVLKHIPHPIVDLSLLKGRHFFVGVGCTMLGQMLFVSPLFWSMYFQTDLFYSPAEAGFLTFIANSALVVGGPLMGFLIDRWGARLSVLTGFFILLYCIIWMLVFTSNDNAYYFLPALIPFGLGIRLILAPSFIQWVNTLPTEKSAVASGINSSFRQFASTMGLGIYGTIFFSAQSHFTAINSLSLALVACGFLVSFWMPHTPMHTD